MLDQNFIQIILTILCGFALSLFLGWLIIPVLRRLKAGQEIREVGPNWHATKAGTPTMAASPSSAPACCVWCSASGI